MTLQRWGTTWGAAAGAGGGGDAPPTFHTPQDLAARRPQFTKRPDPILTHTDTAYSSILWPWVIKVAGLIPAPLDDFYLYYSTSHGVAGGVGLATAPSPTGPWTDRGEVYVDTVDGSQTETPSVLWDEVNNRFSLYYHQKTVAGTQAAQVTLLAHSADGRTNWTRVGVVLDLPVASQFPDWAGGAGHVGYLRPFRIGNLWAGYHNLGGAPFNAISYSHDGLNWHTDPRPLLAEPHLLPDFLDVTDRRLNWLQATPFEWHGRLWLLFITVDFASGTQDKTARICIAPLAHDLRHVLGPAITVWEPTEAWETADISSAYPFADSGKLYVYYQTRTGGQDGTYYFGITEATL